MKERMIYAIAKGACWAERTLTPAVNVAITLVILTDALAVAFALGWKPIIGLLLSLVAWPWVIAWAVRGANDTYTQAVARRASST